jgi:hypothetical protein
MHVDSVDRSTISKILHSRDRWLAPASPPRVPAVRPPPRKVTLRPEGGRYKPVEERINLWLDQRYQVGVVVDDIAVRNEAREVWRMLQRDAGEDVGEDVDDSKSFKASAKWLGSVSLDTTPQEVCVQSADARPGHYVKLYSSRTGAACRVV